MRVFLGGTCNNSTWRDTLTPMLAIDYFNPVVKDWTPECQIEEIRQRESCDYVLYVITPLMTGVYSIAEAVDDSNKRPTKTVFCILHVDAAPDRSKLAAFDPAQLKSLLMVAKMIHANGAKVCESLQDVADYLNSKREKK